MRLIFLTSRLPYPPHRGDRHRTYKFLKHLSRDHEITLLSFVANRQELQQVASLSSYCEEVHSVPLPGWRSKINVVQGAWRNVPLQVLYYRSRAMQQMIEVLIKRHEFDAAYVHLFRMAPYLEQFSSIYRILDLTDLVSLELAASLPYRSAAWRMLYQFEQPRIASYEIEVASRYDEVWFISDRDRAAFLSRSDHANSQVIPIGVNRSLFDVKRKEEQPNTLYFVGHLEVAHNIDAVRFLARDIMPLVLDEFPECELRIVGAGNSGAIEDLIHYRGVRLIGFAPDLGKELSRCTVFVAPLRFSAGIQTKVLEAMAVGLPVVTGEAVSAGLGTRHGRDLFVAESAEEYATHIRRLLIDDRLNRQIGQAGRVYVQNHFSWQTAVNRLRLIGSQLRN